MARTERPDPALHSEPLGDLRGPCPGVDKKAALVELDVGARKSLKWGRFRHDPKRFHGACRVDNPR